MKKSKKISGIIAVIILMTIIFSSIFANKIAPYDPNYQDSSRRLESISMDPKLGTDDLGRDLLSRIIYGAKTSILIALVATVVSMFVGILVGTIGRCYG